MDTHSIGLESRNIWCIYGMKYSKKSSIGDDDYQSIVVQTITKTRLYNFDPL